MFVLNQKHLHDIVSQVGRIHGSGNGSMETAVIPLTIIPSNSLEDVVLQSSQLWNLKGGSLDPTGVYFYSRRHNESPSKL